jgi:HK97 family phage major capsid protein
MADEKVNLQIDTKEDLRTFLTNAIAETLKSEGFGKVEARKGVFPGTTSEELTTLTKEQRFRKWFNGVISGDNSVVQKATLVEGSGSGSYIVPKEWASEIFAVVGRFGRARQYCSVLTPSGNVLYVPDMTADVSVTVPGENTALSETIPTVAQKTLTIKAVGGISPMSAELMEDNNVDLLGFLAKRFGLAFAKFEDTNVFGSSSSYFSAMLSGLTSAKSVTMPAGSITGISADDLQACRRAVSEDYWPNAKFFMHPYVLSYVEQIKTAEGSYLIRQPADSAQNKTIWGHDIVTVSGMPSSDAAGTAFIGFGDPSFCVIGTRQDMAIKLLDQATLTTAGNLAEKNLIALRAIERFGAVWTNEAGIAVLSTAAA